MEENLRQEETAQENITPEPFQEPNDMQMEAPEPIENDEAKKFQSMYDKKTAEYDKLNAEVSRLKEFEKLGTLLRDRPDVVDAMKKTLSGEQEQMKGIQETVAVNNLKGELSSKYGFSDNGQIDDFIKFATQPRQDVPLEMLVDVYRRYNNTPTNSSENVEAVKRTQSIPQSAGVLQGGEGKKPNEMEDIWKGVLSASSRNNVL